MNAKARKKQARKLAALNANREPPIPIHKQSVDLTPANATAEESLKKREELVRSMRSDRRKGIREANFLRGM